MDAIRLFGTDEFNELFGVTFRSLFSENLYWDLGDYPFLKAGWKACLMPDSPDGGWIDYEGEREFANDIYPCVEGLEHFFEPFFAAHRAWGGQQVVFTESLPTWVRTKDPEQVEAWPRRGLFEPSVEFFLSKHAPTYPFCCFDPVGRWAMVSAVEPFTLIGGEPDFMDHFFACAGGEECLKMNFYYHTLNGDICDPSDRWEERVRQIYSLAGWKVPRFMPNMELPIDWDWVMGKFDTVKPPELRHATRPCQGIRPCK